MPFRSEPRYRRAPLLPLRDTVVFPGTFSTVIVGQERSVRLVGEALEREQHVALVAQREPSHPAATMNDLHRIGTLARLNEIVQAQDRAFRIVVHGIERIRIADIAQSEPYLIAAFETAPEIEEHGIELESLSRAARDLFSRFVTLDPDLPDELVAATRVITEPLTLAYLVASSMSLPTPLRQEILELDSTAAKLRRLVEAMQHEVAVRELVKKITTETAVEMNRAQREHVLRKQMESIQRELGDVEPEAAQARGLRERIQAAPLPEEARNEANRELERLERIPSISPEHGLIATYLDWMLKLPWNRPTGAPIDVVRARQVLDEDHFDLQKVKDRIVEYLAVKRLREQRGAGGYERAEPILCFLGPPGVGKTSLGQSIARAMGRTFARISLGGTHDEAEIRGHRRTYIGAMPGRILQAITRTNASDPVFMLDEVDKLGVGFHGDPSAALLEVLDPAQNHAFVDNYMGVAFDLSRVLFICTANTTETIPPALLDRMEVLQLAGYTDHEKLAIAQRYLIPQQMAAHGLREGEVVIADESLHRLIHGYTREAGVRNLEREIASVLRKATRRIGEGASGTIVIDGSNLKDYLGPQRFYSDIAERLDRPGVATGLGWTPAGGDLLFVEATMMPGDSERLILTGMLGDVMSESAQAALSYLKTNAERFGIDPHVFEHRTVHIHVPAGAIPKDGPSAGVTILVALASMALGRPVRNDVGMTGEITLRGKVLPVGGIKEKVLAAHRAGLKTIVLPKRSESALDDVPEEVRRACNIVLAESVDEVAEQALGIPAEAERTTLDLIPPVH